MARGSTNSLALVSIIAGVLSWVVAPLLAAIVAVVCGHIARSQIQATGEDGDVFAVVGMVLGYLNLAVACIVPCLIFGGFISLAGIASVAQGG